MDLIYKFLIQNELLSCLKVKKIKEFFSKSLNGFKKKVLKHYILSDYIISTNKLSSALETLAIFFLVSPFIALSHFLFDNPD